MRRGVAPALLALAAAACGGARATPEAARPDARTSAQLEALVRARADSERSRFTEADVRFMTGMIGHHAQALLMAALAPAREASPALRTLAARIDNAQRDEITLMQEWLRERGRPVPQVHVDVAALAVHGAGHDGHHMPGLLTPEQLRQLDQARGNGFDRLFLTFMIQHHQGAITMVDELIASDGAALDQTVFRLSAAIRVDQETEIARMRSMLRDLAPPGPPR